ncbi:MAG: sensor histidine kinase [Alphaproteobacteria bacterium]|nr:sensor histidine kinase [Alphaproteobacteria bacterium]
MLGDQLIGRDYLAVFELVKNAYDADASYAYVSIEELDSDDPYILVEDDGDGMDEVILVNKWLEIGNDHREKQRKARNRTARFGRLPLGEKGLGRIACHKLGNVIEITTKQKGKPEYYMRIVWDELLENEYLSDTRVEIVERRKPEVFSRDQPNGTQIIISELKSEWPRGEVRSLNRAITSICSPFEQVGDFDAELRVPGYEHWVESMWSSIDMVDNAPWSFSFKLTGKRFKWSYEFKPPPGWASRVSSRKSKSKPEQQLLLPRSSGRVVLDPAMLVGIGSISGQLFAYDKDAKISKLYPEARARNDFLKEQSGVRVYREGVRVFNYGEPGDDWLTLDLRRVNRPTEKLSNNIVVGGIHLEFVENETEDERLIEKTNREGFDENRTYQRFQKIVLAIIDTFERERSPDKRRLKQALEGAKTSFERPVETPAAELREKIQKTKYADEFLPLLDKVEADYEKMRDLLLRAGMSGVNLAIVVHEVHRGIVALYEAIRRDVDPNELKEQAHRLVHIFETIAGLLRQKGTKKTDVREVVQTAVTSISDLRFKRHHVKVEYDLPEFEPPFVVDGAFDMLLGALTNLIDNSLYWLRVRHPDIDKDEPQTRKLFVGLSNDMEDGRALIVADNGPGFVADPEDLAEPFVTGRPDGSGLGLYYASLVAQLCGGSLAFPSRDDLDLPDWVDGAIVAMVFPDPNK